MAHRPLDPQTASNLDDGDRSSSDEESDASPGPPPALDVPIPTPGTHYPTWEALRHAVNAWSLREKFLSRCVKKDSTRAVYVCRYNETGCQWRVRAIVARDRPGHVVVSNTCPRHTCDPAAAAAAADDHGHAADDLRPGRRKRKYAKRGVQFTQRWVKDAIARAGLPLAPDTAPAAIVRLIERATGERISESLAAKAKMSLLHARGDAPALPLAPADRRALHALQRRQSRRAERAAAQEAGRGGLEAAAEDAGSTVAVNPPPPLPSSNPAVASADARPFVFESGFRIIAPPPPPPIDERAADAYAMLPPSMGDAAIGGPGGPPTLHHPRPCPTCAGTGVVHGAPADLLDAAGLAGGGAAADDLTVLQQQVAMLGEQIARMQRKALGNV